MRVSSGNPASLVVMVLVVIYLYTNKSLHAHAARETKAAQGAGARAERTVEHVWRQRPDHTEEGPALPFLQNAGADQRCAARRAARYYTNNTHTKGGVPAVPVRY